MKILRFRKTGTLITVIIIATVCLLSEGNNFIWRKEVNKAFSVGEKLNFAVSWQFIYVGTSSMEVRETAEIENRKAYHIVTEAKSAPFFDVFFKVRDINESWMDIESLCSLKFAANISASSLLISDV